MSSSNQMEILGKQLDKINLKSENPLSDIKENLDNFTNLISLFQEFRKSDILLTQELLEKVQSGYTLSGAELFTLRKSIQIYYKINEKILNFSKTYDFGEFKFSKTFPHSERSLPLMKAHLIWLTGHLIVLDYLEKIHEILYERNATFRRIVKSALLDKGFYIEETDKTLRDIIKLNSYTVEIGESLKFSQQVNLVRLASDELKEILHNEASSLNLIDVINNNDVSKKISQENLNLLSNRRWIGYVKMLVLF
jgi:hypothetical protein